MVNLIRWFIAIMLALGLWHEHAAFAAAAGSPTPSLEEEGLVEFEPPLIMAARVGNLPFLLYLLSIGADVNQQDSQGDSALHLAVLDRRVEIAHALLQVPSVDPNIANEDGETPLLLSVRSQADREILKLLLDHGQIDLNLANSSTGETALHRAVEYGNEEAVSWLLDLDVDVNLLDVQGKRAVDIALEEPSSGCLSLLICKCLPAPPLL